MRTASLSWRETTAFHILSQAKRRKQAYVRLYLQPFHRVQSYPFTSTGNMVSQTSPSDLVRATAWLVASNSSAAVTVDEQACEQAAEFLHNLMSRKPHTYASVSQSWCFANSLHPYNPSPNALNWLVIETAFISNETSYQTSHTNIHSCSVCAGFSLSTP